MSELELPDDVDVAHNNVEQSNSSVIIGHKVVLKLFRRLESGLHPEAEFGHYLSEHGFEHVPPLYGEVARRNADGESQTLMLVQGFIANQGDAWSWTRNALERAIREASEESEASAEEGGYSALDELEEFATTLGNRLGELHRILALPSDNPDFAPEQSDDTHVAAWSQRVREQVEKALDLLERHKGNASEADQALAGRVLAERDTLLSAIEPLAQQAKGVCSLASMAICISGRCWWRMTMRTSSISRVSPPVRWKNGAPRTVRYGMSPACCAHSTMPAPRWTKPLLASQMTRMR
ncbi:hypothetical protein [Modicisalibacter luteus]|uniref:hypothetical protein n=1 Tax=Modicisalibacter luteus TaxID=453962 RepID=UPI00363EB875